LTTEAGEECRLEAVVLAAGSGSRFGGGKLLAPFRGGVVLDGALAAAFAAPARTVTVVTGADAEKVQAAARACAERAGQAARLRIVHAPDHAEGMGASLRTGVASLTSDAQGAFVFLGDMPRVPVAVPPLLVLALAGGAPAAAPVFQGRRGNPVLLGATLFPDVLALQGDAGARAILQGLGGRLALVEAADDGVLFDVDRPGDLAS
jgi:molybdenum cofactor cytidylyltransferase